MTRRARSAIAHTAWVLSCLLGAFALMHWAACEQWDRVCLITGEDSQP